MVNKSEEALKWLQQNHPGILQRLGQVNDTSYGSLAYICAKYAVEQIKGVFPDPYGNSDAPGGSEFM
jgi:hypothetical protein